MVCGLKFKRPAVAMRMLWLCILLPRLSLESQSGPGRTVPRPARAERLALRQLAVWAQQWSSQVSCREPAVDCPGDAAKLWLEIGASLRLFGGEAALCGQLGHALNALGYTGQLAVAPTPQGAALLARAAQSAGADTLSALQQQLEPLPLSLLMLPEKILAGLHSAGLRRIGELLALPDAAIARRFGSDTTRYLQQLCGKMPEPLPMITLPPRFTSRCEFSGAVSDVTALLFPLRRLLGELQGYLRALDRAVQRCTLHLEHHRGRATRLQIGLSRPGRDAAQLLTLVREQLARTTLAAPVWALSLEAHELLQPVVLQGDCFSQEAEQAGQLLQVLDRLGARLGPDAVRQLRSFADHRPEHAWRCRPMDEPAIAGAAALLPERPCWLLSPPRSIAPPPQLLAGPERIESGWWDGADVARDYYLAGTPEGARQWVFCDLRSSQWYLQGLWA